jgi:ATP-binding cassette subfamily B protein
VLPLLIWAANKFRKGVRDSFQEVRNEVARLNAFLQEHITGMQIVQLFNRQEAEAEKFKTINAKHRDANIRGIFYYAVFFPIVDLIVAATLGLIVWYGSAGLLQHTVQPGEITAFIMFINLFFRPVRAIADRFNNIQMGMIAADRIFKLIDDAGNIETGGDVEQAKLKGDIEFKNVWFAYEDENWVIRDLSFTLNAGKTLAIVGHTGSGKTTITSLLSRFYDNQKGDILIDALPVQKYSLKTLRSNIAVVLQDVFLFSGSIAENITLKNQTVDMDAMKEAARKIGAYDFIEKLPGGFDFNVMERGLSLSLGQRQLISFIRALVLNPAILVLDEASSSVDTETELMIQKALDVLLTDRTAIVIAHRLSTIRHADAIMVMDKGAVTEFGNHESLLAKNGQYAKLYHQQFESSTSPV